MEQPPDTSWLRFEPIRKSGRTFDPWLDPNLIGCSCGKCQRGGRCSDMQQLHDEHAQGMQRYERIQSLTDEDRAWLKQNGWDGK